MDLYTEIIFAEKDYRDSLESFFLSKYPGDSLISHGLDHHRRVWEYAKDLIQSTDCFEESVSKLFIRKLLIACYLHDIGMSIEPGVKHGLQSSKQCEKFLAQNHLSKSNFLDTLQAIEHHDDKEYFAPQNDSLMFKILAVADDLDAFGYIGIYRYAEIYLLRGIPLEDMGHMILINASKRFRYFSKSFARFPDLIRKHRKRYEILAEFFRQYESRSTRYLFGGRKPKGHCGVIEIIQQKSKGDKEQNMSVVDPDSSYADPVIKDFFTGLQNELS